MTINGHEYYQLAISHDSGKAHILGGIPDREAADALAARLMEDIRATKR
jgi:hypothetical protein